MKRIAVVVVLSTVLGVGAVVAFSWAREPLERRGTILAQPLRLEAGARAEGQFIPERVGPYEVRIRIKRDRPIEEIAAWIGGRWWLEDVPSGIAISYVVHSEGSVVTSGVVQRLEGRTTFDHSVTIPLVSVPDGRPVQHRVEVQVERAREELAGLTASLEVGPWGDWISYAPLEALVRKTMVVRGIGLVVVAALIALIVLWRRRRLASA